MYQTLVCYYSAVITHETEHKEEDAHARGMQVTLVQPELLNGGFHCQNHWHPHLIPNN